MRWFFIGIAVCAFASFWGAGVEYLLLLAFVVLFVNFASFCLLYDRPRNRARDRVAESLRGLNPNSDTAQRLSTKQIVPTADDRKLGFGPMTILNLATGIAAGGLLTWGVLLRVL